ncbi:MAG: hypothetical protein QM724_08075 [Flavobacteriales bacterium]
MMALWGYLLLSAITAGYAWCVRALYRRTRDVSVVVGAVVLFLWTFAGAWFFIGDAALGFPGFRIGLGYYYLMEKMFPFVLDGNYLLSLACYALFMGAMFGSLFLLVPRPYQPLRRTVAIDHRYMLLGGALCMAVSMVMAWPVVKYAAAHGASIYLAMHEQTGVLASVRSWADRAAALCFLFGYAIFLVPAGSNALFAQRSGPWHRWNYPAALLLLGTYLSLLGDRHTLFTVLILALVYLFGCMGRAAWRRSGFLIATCVCILAFGGWVRGFTPQGTRPEPDRSPFSLSAIAHVPRQQEGPLRKAGNAVFGNELFAAHFSMYGILEQRVPVAPGISFKYLIATLVPTPLRTSTPPTVYDHYAEAAHLVPGQGYTIHAAAGWYLNLGWAGLPIGGAVLGAIWAWLLRLRMRPLRTSHVAWDLLPYLFVAYLPPVVRSGPEGLRALVVEGCIIPLLILFLAAVLPWPFKSHLVPNGRER